MNKLIKRMKTSVEYAENEGENMDDVSWGMQEGILISYNEAKEIITLKEWKVSAIKLLNDLDLQEIAKEIGLKPGQDIVSKILPFIKELKSKTVV
jgi:hypothetical protein